MSMMRSTERAAEATGLAEYAEELGLSDADLDDLVHDVASEIGSRTNDGGVRSQVEFLLEELGAAAARDALDDVARVVAKRSEP